MNKDLQTLVSVYARYLNSLKAEGADIKKNYSSMRDYIKENCDEWLKGHMLQDCYINCLRAYHNKPIETSLVIQELTDTNCSEKSIDAARIRLTVTIENNGEKVTETRTSWLPTLYEYFRPSNEEELDYMAQELEKMEEEELISPSDFWSVRELVFNPIAKTEQYINESSTSSSSDLIFQVIDGEKVLKELEEEELVTAEAK